MTIRGLWCTWSAKRTGRKVAGGSSWTESCTVIRTNNSWSGQAVGTAVQVQLYYDGGLISPWSESMAVSYL